MVVAHGSCIWLLHVVIDLLDVVITLPSMVNRNLSEAAIMVPERVETVPVDDRVWMVESGLRLSSVHYL